MDFEAYLQEAAGNLAGFPSKWTRAMRSSMIGENSEVETTGVKVKSWSALTGAIRRALPDGEPGLAIFINDMPAYLILADSWAGSRTTYSALTADGSAIMKRVASRIPDHAARAHARARGLRSNATTLYYRDVRDHTKSEIVDKIAAGIRETLGIDWDEKRAPVEFTLRKIKVDKKRIELAKQRQENRPGSPVSQVATSDTAMKARQKLIMKKLEGSPGMKKLVGIYNAFHGSSLTPADFVRQAVQGKDFSVDEKLIREYTEAARNMSSMAQIIRSVTNPDSWRGGDRRAAMRDIGGLRHYLPKDLYESFEGEEEEE